MSGALAANARPCLPPLRVHHFLLWTAVTAVAASLQSSQLRDAQPTPFAYQGVSLIWLIGSTASATALGVVVWARRHGQGDWQPGHGLLVLQTLNLAQWVLLWLPLGGPLTLWRVGVQQMVFGVLTLGISLLLARAYRGTPWGWLFVLLALAPLLQPLLRALAQHVLLAPFNFRATIATAYAVQLALSGLTCAVAALGLLHDRRRGVARHWTHWVGVAPLVLGVVLSGVILVVELTGAGGLLEPAG